MPEKTFHVVGRVIDRKTGSGVPGLNVEAWDKDLLVDDFVKEATTDPDGRFHMEVRDERFKELFFDRRPDLFFRVRLGDELIASTEDSVLWQIEAKTTEVPDIEVDLPPNGQPSPQPEVPHKLIGQLLNDESGEPLVRLTVRAFDLDAGEKPKKLGYDITSGRGFFTVVYTTPAPADDVAAEAPSEDQPPQRRLRLHVMGRKGGEIYQTEVVVVIDQPDVLEVRVPVDALPQPPSHPLAEVVGLLNVPIPEQLLPFLAGKDVHTLEDIRRAGGIARLEGLPIDPDDPAVRALESHAVLAVLCDEVEVNVELTENDYTCLAKIAKTPRSEFVSDLHETIGDFRAGQLHTKARAQTRVLDNVLAGRRAELANRPRFYTETSEEAVDGQIGQVDAQIAQLYPLVCNCPDCEAAVSPLAYLADLIKYATEHLYVTEPLGNDASPVQPTFLQETFYQQFAELTASCEEVNRRVRQVRVCIEVLRRYLLDNLVDGSEQALCEAEAQYRLAVYDAILHGIGTSFEELRLARTWPTPAPEREELAARLGIGLTDPGEGDELNQLLLDPDSGALTERSLEKLFGLADTNRDPLSEGATWGPGHEQIVRWDLDGVEWNRNTDPNGTVYVSLTHNAGVYRVRLFRDPKREELVASGEQATSAGVVRLRERSNSGLSGRVTIEYATGGEQIEISALPRFVSWRLKHLRDQWRELDWPTDSYSHTTEPEDRLPVIDPDLIGPDDLRRPIPGEPPFDLWKKRRQWVDAQLKDLEDIASGGHGHHGGPVPAFPFQRLLERMYRPVSYPGARDVEPWKNTDFKDFDAIRDRLTQGTETEVEDARTVIWEDLRLTVEGFLRLLEIRDMQGPGGPLPLEGLITEELWQEVFSILVQAQKRRLFDYWCYEEHELETASGDSTRVLFGPEHFWISVRQPEPGDWPPFTPAEDPLIDPELVDLKDLPERTTQDVAQLIAREVWQARRDALDDKEEALREIEDFAALLHAALGDPHLDLDQIQFELRNDETHQQAVEQIENELYMSVEDFTKLMEIREKALGSSPTEAPTPEEWDTLYVMLVSSWKRRTRYADWHGEESKFTQQEVPGVGVAYWRLLKARLPRWRASAAARHEWQSALRRRSGTPHVDPDLITTADLRNPISGPALETWCARSTWITDCLKSHQPPSPPDRVWFNQQIQDTLGITVEEFEELLEKLQVSSEVAARLEQLNLTTDAFSRLAGIRRLVASGETVLDSEWKDVSSILVQVLKCREFAQWRFQERAQDLVLAGDQFKIADPPPLQFPLPEPEPLPAWRATWRQRRDWQDALQSRLEQAETVVNAIEEAVGGAEEVALPLLRDALIAATGRCAKWLTDHLLIDCQTAGCQKTSRVAQAIATIQNLLFSLRTGQIWDTYLTLALFADDFEEEWKWIGSYATWRAATFVFLYPENVLLPHLKRWQTPGFRQLVKELRGNRRLTPEQARAAAKRYEDYFRDVCNLTLEAAVQAGTVYRGDDSQREDSKVERDFVYLFARSAPPGNRVYFSRYEPDDGSDYAQTFWEEVPGFDNVKNVVGAAAYAVSSEDRHLYLFVRVREGYAQKLRYTTYDLQIGKWSGETGELDLPEEAHQFTAVVKQRNREDEQPHLAIRLSDGAIYARRMNADGTDWDDTDGDWHPLVGRALGKEMSELLAMMEPARDEFYLFAMATGSNVLGEDLPTPGIVGYRLFGSKDDGLWRPLSGRVLGVSVSGGAWIGGFPWPTPDRVCTFWKPCEAPDLVLSTSLRRPNDELPTSSIDGFLAFDDRLKRIAGVSLANLESHPLTQPTGVFVGENSVLGVLLRSLHDPVLEDVAPVMLHSLALRLESDETPSWDDWRLADELIQEFTSSSSDLSTALFALLDGKSVGFKDRKDELRDAFIAMSGLQRIAPGSQVIPESDGESSDLSVPVAYEQSTADGTGIYRSSFQKQTDDEPIEGERFQAAPFCVGPCQITERVSEAGLHALGDQIEQEFEANSDAPASILTYLEEAWYFVPVHIALQLQRRKQFTAALDWFRTVYDYTAPVDDRFVYGEIEPAGDRPLRLERAENWLLDPLNPHAIAADREGTYARFTILSLIRCFLDFADAEFTRDTAESLPRARTLYMTALELLNLPGMQEQLGPCAWVVDQLDDSVDDPAWHGSLSELKRDLGRIERLDEIGRLVEDVKDVLQSTVPEPQKFLDARDLIRQTHFEQPGPWSFEDLLQRTGRLLEQAHGAMLTDDRVAGALGQVGFTAGEDFRTGIQQVTGLTIDPAASPGSDLEIPWLRIPRQSQTRSAATAASGAQRTSPPSPDRLSITPGFPDRPGPSTSAEFLKEFGQREPHQLLRLVQTVSAVFVPEISTPFCVPPNPIPRSLRLHAELNLYKLRHCRNIAGVQREIPLYGAATDVLSGMPSIGEGGQLVIPGMITPPATPYRYEYLVERAKQFADRAGQMEAAFLAALEKRDAEYYNLMKARQDVQLARAGVRLQNLRVREAEDGVSLAELQLERVEIRTDHYDELLGEPISRQEAMALDHYQIAAGFSLAAAGVTWLSGEPVQTFSSMSQFFSLQAQIAQLRASYERRRQEWEFQQNLALHDLRIGAQQLKLAQDRVRIVSQEHRISQMQTDFAEDTAEFLANKFTNVELYDWMSQVLEEVYSFFLDEAAGVAKLAEQQLAFERQESPPDCIQADYWEAPSDDMIAPGPDQNAPDRRGLTGSARLLADIHKLDQYRFETEKRKLQLTRTISLACLDPFAFQRFRETGVMNFDTAMETFDRDFPGHHLRLIKRVRTSIIALIPPTAGVHATLTTTGLSRVVVGSDALFQTILVRRPPESIALSSPQNATGLFELTPQSHEMLLPFESMGVDTGWELRMPKAANLFDYRTIADVLVTMEYTALDSYDYRQQVIRELDDTISADRPFSFRHQFADAWYDLHNPDQTPDQTPPPMTVRFNVRCEDFPANVESPKIQQVVLYFAPKEDTPLEFKVKLYCLDREQGEAVPLGGEATSQEGIISTRAGNAGSWTSMIGKSPVGEWELALPNTEEVKGRFKNEEIEDILFVITFSGRTPEWPA